MMDYAAGLTDASMSPANRGREREDVMKNHEKRHTGTTESASKRGSKIEPTADAASEGSLSNRPNPTDPVEDSTARITFVTEFSLSDGKIEGKITHRLTGKFMEFVGLDQTAITQFMKKYLSGLDRGLGRAMESEPLPLPRERQRGTEKAGSTPDRLRTKSFHVIPAGTGRPADILQQGQPFQLQWSFEPPDSLVDQGQQLSYAVSICKKKLAGGRRELLGEIKGDIACCEALTANIHSEPLPSGTYRLEADARFSLKNKKTGWVSAARDSRLIHVT